MIGIGVSEKPDSSQAGREAAQRARDLLDRGESIAWALAFSGGRHNANDVLRGLRTELGEIPIVGGAAVGTITNGSLGYTGYECAVAGFPASIPTPTVITLTDLEKGEAKVGRDLGAKLRETARESDTVLLFYDSLRSGPPPLLYVGSRLLDGVYESLGGKPLNLIGAGLIGDFQISRSHIFDGQQAVKHALVAVILPRTFQGHSTIMHGCAPVSDFLEITRIDGPVVYELDHRPARDVLEEILRDQEGASEKDNLSLFITLGEKHDDPYAPYNESAYVNRLILNSNPDNGTVTLFEADFHVGTRVQIMSHDNQTMVESAKQRSRDLRKSLGDIPPVFALYIDCAGRACAFSGGEEEEAAFVQSTLGQEIPLLGFYSGVEIAPLLGRSRPLDWTGVLTLFTLENTE